MARGRSSASFPVLILSSSMPTRYFGLGSSLITTITIHPMRTCTGRVGARSMSNSHAMVLIPENSINIKIDIRSSLNFIVLAVIAMAAVIFLLSKISDATFELDRLANSPVYAELRHETAPEVGVDAGQKVTSLRAFCHSAFLIRHFTTCPSIQTQNLQRTCWILKRLNKNRLVRGLDLVWFRRLMRIQM